MKISYHSLHSHPNWELGVSIAKLVHLATRIFHSMQDKNCFRWYLHWFEWHWCHSQTWWSPVTIINSGVFIYIFSHFFLMFYLTEKINQLLQRDQYFWHLSQNNLRWSNSYLSLSCWHCNHHSDKIVWSTLNRSPLNRVSTSQSASLFTFASNSFMTNQSNPCRTMRILLLTSQTRHFEFVTSPY